MTHTTTTGARMATLLTTAQREALEKAVRLAELFQTRRKAPLLRALHDCGIVEVDGGLSIRQLDEFASYLLAADARLRDESPPPTALTAREKWLIWTAYIAGIDATPEQRFHDDAGFALWLGDAAQLLAAAPAVSA